MVSGAADQPSSFFLWLSPQSHLTRQPSHPNIPRLFRLLLHSHQHVGRCVSGFDMLLDVRFRYPQFPISSADSRSCEIKVHALAGVLILVAGAVFWRPALEVVCAQTPAAVATNAAAQAPAANVPAPPATKAFAPPSSLSPNSLNVVVLDPAHGGTDPGARGTGGIRESEVALEFAAQIRRALEAQGLQVISTRLGDENPSFDDRSAMANAQRGAIFITLHISSTGLPGTARVYVNSDIPLPNEPNGLLPWDQAQAPFLNLSHKLGDTVQGLLSQRFKGSPREAQTASVRQLRTTAAPAIAVEISSVSVERREDLDRMAPGVADAIARGVAAFRPSYVVPVMALGAQSSTPPTTEVSPVQVHGSPSTSSSAPAKISTSSAAKNGVAR
jgi:N-acetylmuramoyl-L-alanine amidase